MSDERPFSLRFWEDAQRVVGQAFADAIERGDLEVADRWLKSMLVDPPTPAERQEADA